MKKEMMIEIWGWVKSFGLAFIFAYFITHVILVNAVVPTGSMESTISPGDRIFGSRLSYLFHEPERGDIVVFKYPVNEKLLEIFKGKEWKEFRLENGIKHINYIKRLIGMPGEKVEIKDGKIYINDSKTPLDEPYLKEEWLVENDGFVFEIPEDCYLMLGDNRNNSADSRYWVGEAAEILEEGYEGLSSEEVALTLKDLSYVKKSQLVGKAYVRYWPLTKISVLK